MVNPQIEYRLLAIQYLHRLEEAQKGFGLGFEEKVKELMFRRLKLDDTRIHLVKGCFSDTLPVTDTGKITGKTTAHGF